MERSTFLPVDFLIDVLSFCLNTTYFVYDGTYYQQVFGTVMRSTVSAVIANLVMLNKEHWLCFGNVMSTMSFQW